MGQKLGQIALKRHLLSGDKDTDSSADRRNRDSDRSPSQHRAAKIRTAVKNAHHRSGQRSQNSPLRSGNNPSLAGGGARIRRRATACLPRLTGRINPS